MTLKARTSNVLVIQPRLNTNVIAKEQANLRKIVEKIDVKLTFVNPLQNNKEIQWDNPSDLLHKFGCSIWLGSGDIDLSQQTQERERYINRVLPLAQKILAEDEFAMGICLGHQTFALAGGVKIEKINNRAETGTTILKLTPEGKSDVIFYSLPSPISIVYSHKDSVTSLPFGFAILGYTIRDQYSALRRGKIITMQGHPEITDTTNLKKKMAIAPQHTLNGYELTYPVVDPGQTDVIIRNFLTNAFH
jgi:GMP synthase-like glutamine amidotransferase